jgi:cysteinyl-tRNA synthetase
LEQFFTGNHPMLTQAYPPMTIRFYIMQAHYRSTADFSDEALRASGKGLERLLETNERLQKLHPSSQSSVNVTELQQRCDEAMCDDLNTPIVISHLFETSKAINLVADGKATLSKIDLETLKNTFRIFMEDVLGLQEQEVDSRNMNAYKKAVDLLLTIRLEAKQNKDWATSDKIRNELAGYGFTVKDTKEGFEWNI